MDRHEHDGPSRGLLSKHLDILNLGTENRLSELRNGMAGRTVTDSLVEIESLNLAMTCRTDRRRHDGPSQARQAIAGTTGRRRLRNSSLGRIYLYVLRDIFDYSCFNYKVSGLMLISLITWGLKEVTLSKLVGYYCHLLFLIIC